MHYCKVAVPLDINQIPFPIHLHLSHLADALIQSDLQIGAFTLWHPVEQPLYNSASKSFKGGGGVRRISLSYPRYSLKRWGFRCLRKVVIDSAVLASWGSLFHHWGARAANSFDWAERELYFLSGNICHLADAFIQSDLQSCVHTFYVWVVPGIEPTTLALQAPCSTNWATEGPLKVHLLRLWIHLP